ncbi:MAG: ATP-grasp domain-containing protein [bacterium]
MKNTVLIFGGGENQLTLIKAAKELNVRSVVIDPNPDAPGKIFADNFEIVNPNDYELTKEIAIKYKAAGIVTSQMENPLRLMARLADEMGYIFPKPAVIERARNKFLMKKAFLNGGIPCANGKLFNKDEIIDERNIFGLDFPLIIKPADAFSSRGVFKVGCFEELKKLEPITRGFSSDKSILVEEFIEGNELSIEAITYKGDTHIIQYTKKLVTPFPYTVEMGHIQPADITTLEKEEINSIVKKSINALGIDNTATHTELKITNKGAVIIEIGARLGGDFISSYLTQSSTGVNMDKAAIQIALGQEPDIRHTVQNYSYIKYLELPVSTTIVEVEEWRELLKNDDVVFGGIHVKPGDMVKPIEHSAARPGFIIVKGSSITEVKNKADNYLIELKYKIHYT